MWSFLSAESGDVQAGVSEEAPKPRHGRTDGRKRRVLGGREKRGRGRQGDQAAEGPGGQPGCWR